MLLIYVFSEIKCQICIISIYSMFVGIIFLDQAPSNGEEILIDIQIPEGQCGVTLCLQD